MLSLILNPKDYECDCGWCPPDDEYFIDNNGEISYLWDFDENGNEVEVYIHNQTIYPIIKDKSSIHTDEVLRYDWTEVHYCPHCNKTFEVFNSN